MSTSSYSALPEISFANMILTDEPNETIIVDAISPDVAFPKKNNF